MPEPRSFESRLRAALGPGGPVASRPVAGGADDGTHGAVRAHVVAGVHHARMRRLQLLGGALAAIVALAVVLPLVVVGSTTPARTAQASGAPGAHAATAPPAAHSSQPGSRAASGTPGEAACTFGGATRSPVLACGTIVSAPSAGATPSSGSTAFGTTRPAGGPPIPTDTLHVGQTLTVTLPAPRMNTTWKVPAVLHSTPAVAGQAVVSVRPTGSSPTTGVTGLAITAQHAGTAVVAVYSGPHCVGRMALCAVARAWELTVRVVSP